MKKKATTVILLALALSSSADILTWVGTTGDYETSSNWDLGSVPTSADEVRLDNGGAAVISSGSHQAGKLYMGRLAGKSGSLSMSGGSLTVGTAAYIGSANGTVGDLTMTGASVLSVGNIQVGSRGTATVNVGSAAEVNSSILYVSSLASAQGTVDLAGTWNATKVILCNSGGNGRLNLNGGALAVSGDFDMDNSADPSRLSINGSAGSFSADNFLGASSAATLDFIADASGFTTLTMADSIDITGATLNIDLSAYSGSLGVTLMDGSSLAGTFGSVNIIGGSGSESIVYDTANGDLKLVPEPATIGLVGLAGTGLIILRKRFKH